MYHLEPALESKDDLKRWHNAILGEQKELGVTMRPETSPPSEGKMANKVIVTKAERSAINRRLAMTEPSGLIT